MDNVCCECENELSTEDNENLYAIQNCKRKIHRIHKDCFHDRAVAANDLIECRGCIKENKLMKCYLCNDKVSEENKDKSDLCKAPPQYRHIYHSKCIRLHKEEDENSLKSCPACVRREELANRNPPCIVCGDRRNHALYDLNSCKKHKLHMNCKRGWDRNKLLKGCLCCKTLKILCPICNYIIGNGCVGHSLKRCHDCNTILMNNALENHECDQKKTNGYPLCSICGISKKTKSSSSNNDTHERCIEILKKYIKQNKRGGKSKEILYKCMICSEEKFVNDLSKHFKDAHEPVICKTCGFFISKHVIESHEAECLNKIKCPAQGCNEKIAFSKVDLSFDNPGILKNDHDCNHLFECPYDCKDMFLTFSERNDHLDKCDGKETFILNASKSEIGVSRKRNHRQAFLKSKDGLFELLENNLVEEK